MKLTVVVTRYHEPNSLVSDCLVSLSQQDISLTVLFLDQKESVFAKRLSKKLTSPKIKIDYINIPAKSLSFARNYGVNAALSQYVAFCDVDCILPFNWASSILETFKDTQAAIVGTKIIPKWQGSTSWYHHSSLIKEFYSLIDLSSNPCPIPKIVGASFALDKKLLKKNAYFDENLGRQKGNFLGGEETDLCQRASNLGLTIYYTPKTFAYHQVPVERLNLSWIQKRAFFGGLSRAKRGGKSQPFNQKFTLRDYFALSLIFPSYLSGFLTGKIRS